jgi:hypothetical protein
MRPADSSRSILEAAIEPRRGRIEGGRRFQIQRLVRAFVVVALDERIEARLLLQDIGRGWVRRFRVERQMQALMATVLLGMPGRNPLEPDADAQPPHRQLTQPIQRMRGRKPPLSVRIACGKPKS